MRGVNNHPESRVPSVLRNTTGRVRCPALRGRSTSLARIGLKNQLTLAYSDYGGKSQPCQGNSAAHASHFFLYLIGFITIAIAGRTQLLRMVRTISVNVL
ncbi:hypothetical protein ACFS07_07725 [Undibacterium arcticum]